MELFKKRREKLIKESIQVAKEEVGKNVEPAFIFLAAIGFLAFMSAGSQPQNSQPVIINIYNKEV